MQTNDRKLSPTVAPAAPSPLFTDSLPRQPIGVPPPRLEAVERSVHEHARWVEAVRHEMAQVIVGQTALVDRLLVALLAGGHVLLEGVPGLAKTLSLKTLSGAIEGTFQRIQFTPDMLPADVVGTLIYNPQQGTFETKKGPVFANFILADEINRAPAKVQSALLEAMQERQVTLGNETHPLPSPFLVMATQNPIEQEGTYPLPEAQVDRFLLKVNVGYPSPDEELRILEAMSTSAPRLEARPVVALEEIRGGPAADRRDLRRRENQTLHREPGGRHAGSPRARTVAGRADPLRGLSARHHRHHAGREGVGLPARTRLRHAAGREGHCP